MTALLLSVARWGLLLLGAAALAATALPAWPTDLWWVRFLAYPRLQIMLLALAGLLAVGAFWGLWRSGAWMGAGAAAAFAAAAAWNAALLSPYLVPLVAPWPQPEVAAGACGPGDRLRVLSVNVQRSNRHDSRLLGLVKEADPDVAWFQEVDAWWEQELSPLGASMPHGIADVQANYFGMHLYSKLPLVGPKVSYLTRSRNPSVFTAVAMPSGEPVQLYAVHPRPPQVGQGTAERDGQLTAAALAARDDTEPHVLMGDLNSVPWEEVIQRTKRIGGFLDPRTGRGLYITWNAHDVVARWPLDHVLPGPGFTLVDLRVLSAFGSDHYPLLAELCRSSASDVRQARQEVPPGELEAARRTVRRGQGKAAGPGSAEPAGADSVRDD